MERRWLVAKCFIQQDVIGLKKCRRAADDPLVASFAKVSIYPTKTVWLNTKRFCIFRLPQTACAAWWHDMAGAAAPKNTS